MNDDTTGLPAERYRRLRELFDAAQQLPVAAREAFVRQAAGTDAGLAEECLRLLDAPDVASTALAAGALQAVAAAEALPRQIGRRGATLRLRPCAARCAG